jgi:hypothetical protein
LADPGDAFDLNKFLREGGSPDEYRAGIERLKADGLISMHVAAASSPSPRREPSCLLDGLGRGLCRPSADRIFREKRFHTGGHICRALFAEYVLHALEAPRHRPRDLYIEQFGPVCRNRQKRDEFRVEADCDRK